MLTAKQKELLMFIDRRLKKDGVAPSFEEMKEALGLKSKSGVHRLIKALEERGFIRRLENRARALEVTKLPEGDVVPLKKRMPAPANDREDDIVDIPLHGRIAAGQPIEAMETAETLTLPTSLLGRGDHYALEVSGESMIEAGIFDGDYALIERCETASDGDIVVALINDEDATLKYLRKNGDMIRLDPANSEMQPQNYPARAVRIQGKLVGLLRRY